MNNSSSFATCGELSEIKSHNYRISSRKPTRISKFPGQRNAYQYTFAHMLVHRLSECFGRNYTLKFACKSQSLSVPHTLREDAHASVQDMRSVHSILLSPFVPLPLPRFCFPLSDCIAHAHGARISRKSHDMQKQARGAESQGCCLGHEIISLQ